MRGSEAVFGLSGEVALGWVCNVCHSTSWRVGWCMCMYVSCVCVCVRGRVCGVVQSLTTLSSSF